MPFKAVSATIPTLCGVIAYPNQNGDNYEMKKTTIAFLYNVRHKYPDPDNPKSHLEADFDDPETIESIIDHFKKCNFRVLPIEANENAYTKLKRNRSQINLAVNYSLGMYGIDRYAQIPSMCEMLRIPYTGSGPLTEALGALQGKNERGAGCQPRADPAVPVVQGG